jgi:hypothetical protein
MNHSVQQRRYADQVGDVTDQVVKIPYPGDGCAEVERTVAMTAV